MIIMQGNRTKSVKPITPEQAKGNIKNVIPEAIIRAVNECISEKFRNNGSFTILQEDIVAKAIKFDERLTSHIIYEKKYLDFEALYREAGWKVEYDKPAYNESYEPYFTFEPKK
jgi:hypothetical protein